MTVRAVVEALLAAIESKDIEAIAACLTEDATWANVPHPPAEGRAAVCDMLGSVLARSGPVRWDIVTAAYDDDRAHLERLDRFWIGGQELVAPCHGVFVVDLDQQRVRAVRDYVDLAPWRAALAAAGASSTTEGRGTAP